jgi:hypothetical protein
MNYYLANQRVMDNNRKEGQAIKTLKLIPLKAVSGAY